MIRASGLRPRMDMRQCQFAAGGRSHQSNINIPVSHR